MKKIKILVIPSDRTGVGAHRSLTPHITLENQYPDLFSVDIDYEPQLDNDEFLKQYDIIHYHRTIGPFENVESVLNRAKNLGVVTIMDIDDYWAPGNHHPAYLLIKNSGMDKKIEQNLRIAHNITTTTPIFAKEISKYNKNVFVLPNAIDETEPQFIPNPTKSEKLRIAWLGGSSHLKDLEILRGLVNRLKTDKLLDKLQFVLCGFDLRGTHTEIDKNTGEQRQRPITPKESVWYHYEKIFTDDYKSVSPEYKDFLFKFVQQEYENVENEPYRRVWTKHISSYATNYNLFDISLAPLEENIFNHKKSQLKVIESGFHKKAIIAQNYGPYQIDLVNVFKTGGKINENGNAILIDSDRNHSDWYKAIKRLINNPEVIEIMKNNLHNLVKERYEINVVNENRKNLYLSLINNNKN
jgi:glycosyltransferase involved in cell wall biosynthesis